MTMKLFVFITTPDTNNPESPKKKYTLLNPESGEGYGEIIRKEPLGDVIRNFASDYPLLNADLLALYPEGFEIIPLEQTDLTEEILLKKNQEFFGKTGTPEELGERPSDTGKKGPGFGPDNLAKMLALIEQLEDLRVL